MFSVLIVRQDISGLSIFEIVTGRTIEGDQAHSEEKAVGGKDFFRRKYNTLQKLSALHLIRQANRQEETKEKAQWRQKKVYSDKKARAVNYRSGDKLLQYYQCCLLKDVNYVTRDLAPHRDKESACSYISKRRR